MVFANSIDKLDSSRELSLAKTATQTAMMWSGTMLKHYNNGETPYKNDGNRETVADIEPMFEATTDTIHQDYYQRGHVVVVDQLRVTLGSWIEEVENDVLGREDTSIKNFVGVNIYQHLVEARMWLGMELGRLRDAAPQTVNTEG